MARASENILKQIVARKRKLVEKRKLQIGIELLKEKINQGMTPVLRPFKAALLNSIKQYDIAIIAELKQASPSKGCLSFNYQPEKIAKKYEKHHAACLSVLTDEEFFLGSDHDLEVVRASTSLPVLRKDFIIDYYQIYESKLLGADCILLIAAVLNKKQLKDFYALAKQLGIEVIIEVANEAELSRALSIKPDLIGINNRDLHTFKVDLGNTVKLRKLIPDELMVICESGIEKREDIDSMLEHNVCIFLIGEALVKSTDPGKKLDELLNSAG